MNRLLTMNDPYPWGKHKGERISTLPIHYRNWVSNNITKEDLGRFFDETVVIFFMLTLNWKYIPQPFYRSSPYKYQPTDDTCPSWQDYDGFAPH